MRLLFLTSSSLRLNSHVGVGLYFNVGSIDYHLFIRDASSSRTLFEYWRNPRRSSGSLEDIRMDRSAHHGTFLFVQCPLSWSCQPLSAFLPTHSLRLFNQILYAHCPPVTRIGRRSALSYFARSARLSAAEHRPRREHRRIPSLCQLAR